MITSFNIFKTYLLVRNNHIYRTNYLILREDYFIKKAGKVE